MELWTKVESAKAAEWKSVGELEHQLASLAHANDDLQQRAQVGNWDSFFHEFDFCPIGLAWAMQKVESVGSASVQGEAAKARQELANCESDLRLRMEELRIVREYLIIYQVRLGVSQGRDWPNRSIY